MMILKAKEKETTSDRQLQTDNAYNARIEKLLEEYESVNEINIHPRGLYYQDIKFIFKRTSDLDRVLADVIHLLEHIQPTYANGCQKYLSDLSYEPDLFRVFTSGTGFTTDGDISYSKADLFRGIGQIRKVLSRNLSSNVYINLSKNIEIILNFL